MDRSGEALRGKKLLILGASADELTLVERAKSYGVHTIVTDYYTDHRVSPAKDIADEYWDISWSDIDALEAKCRERGVNGVCAGYSEFRVESQIKLCARLGLPCYITGEQLEITRDKAKFKDACRRSGVPVVKEYARPEDVDEYPVIVKPVDRGGSIGISVANDAEELRRAYDYAMEMSVCKRVIIEQYITDGTKIDVYYAILDGEIELLTSSDVINAKNNGTKHVVQSGWMFPSRAHGAFQSEVDGNMRSMLRDMGVRNGYIFFSGFFVNRGGVRILRNGLPAVRRPHLRILRGDGEDQQSGYLHLSCAHGLDGRGAPGGACAAAA